MDRVRRAVAFHGGRAWRGAYFRAQRLRGSDTDYLFVSGPEGSARRYRCDHQAEQLRLAGASAHVGYHAQLDPSRLVGSYRTVVLYRVPWDARVERWLAAAAADGSRVLADVDDLVFDLEHTREIRALDQLSDAERRAFHESIERLAETLRAVDGVVVSTQPLRHAAARLNPRVEVVHNVVTRRMVTAGERACRRARADGDGIVLGYLSGTPTHDRDFAEATEAVLETLHTHPRSRLLVVGFLGLDERFSAFGDRVERLAYQPWQRLPTILARVDVNLAPLERENLFTDAKSCLKYLEAALVGVPTIASSRSDFRRVIDDGVNGMLADDPSTWREALESLIESPATRTRIGAAALDDVLAKHTSGARAVETARAFAEAGGVAAE